MSQRFNRFADALLERLVPRMDAAAGGPLPTSCSSRMGQTCSNGVCYQCVRHSPNANVCGGRDAKYCRNYYPKPSGGVSCSAWRYTGCY